MLFLAVVTFDGELPLSRAGLTCPQPGTTSPEGELAACTCTQKETETTRRKQERRKQVGRYLVQKQMLCKNNHMASTGVFSTRENRRWGSTVLLCLRGASHRVLVPWAQPRLQLPEKCSSPAGKPDTNVTIIFNNTVSFRNTFNSMCHFQFVLPLFIYFFLLKNHFFRWPTGHKATQKYNFSS